MANENILPAQKDAYAYCATTRELLGIVKVFLSQDGVYYLPDCVTEVAPKIQAEPYRAVCLNDDGNEWVLVSDYRRVMLYDTATARPLPNSLQLSDALPTGVTVVAPAQFASDEPKCNVWNEIKNTWDALPDYSRFTVYEKATGVAAPALARGVALPETLTTVVPHLLLVPQQAPLWNEDSQTWSMAPDFRGTTYWTADGRAHTISEVGVTPPDDALSTPPDTAAQTESAAN